MRCRGLGSGLSFRLAGGRWKGGCGDAVWSGGDDGGGDDDGGGCEGGFEGRGSGVCGGSGMVRGRWSGGV